ncbi:MULTISPECIES: THUMP-like domain-containing protein [Glutamicibacter]|jgi:SAM-dependent methyltransferase|uniref:SAM-dependent methyltransferase n=1 Tax=Glutamicibacter arilaitensis TaxID=256701 RepID=A0A4Y8TYG3_9MICC|nr:class I SAM-dependent methyltransferase [Glutamicibacter arilaitensis]TFH56631.1 SAM-dependent methyltransferase [Glutamicibacter arilaitensis]HCM94889.1 SAM-dependent methyltransferase [Glutamicibacter sp.]
MAQASNDSSLKEQFTALLSEEGWKLLSTIDPSMVATKDAAWSLNEKLRKDGHDPQVVRAVIAQTELRFKARVKFGPFADSLIFTPAGLEQATRLTIAGLHARRYTNAGSTHVADLGCGIGTDSIALASAGLKVTAVEMDETTAAATTLNLMPFENATVVHGGAEETDLTGIDGVWLDPARRTDVKGSTRRLFDPEAFSPPLSFVEKLVDDGLDVGVKLGPGLPHEAIPDSAEAVWISDHGSVIEACLWFGKLKRPEVTRAALVIDKDGAHELVSSASAKNDALAPVGELEAHIYEPDGAVIRSHLISTLLEQTGGHLLDEHIAYFTHAEKISTPFARGYKVLATHDYNVKKLRSWVKSNAIGTLDIKKRGVDVTPEELRRILLAGSPKSAKNKATLILARLGDKRVAFEVEPH